MKVAFVLDDSLDKTDGVQQYVLTLGHWLKSEGHEVHYLVGQTERTDIPHVHSLSRNIRAHFNQNRMSTPLPASKKLIKEVMAREKFDVLHIQMPYSPYLAGRVIKAAPKTTGIIGTFHVIPVSGLEKLATRALRTFLWRSLKRFDQVVSVSEPAAHFARKAFGAKTMVLPNVVALSQFHAAHKLKKYDDGKINIVFLGRLVERKGALHLLKALQQLHHEQLLINVRVLICGKGPLGQELKDYVRKNHLGAAVHFIGFVDEADKPKYLASADIAVFPSTGGESFGIVLIEAMAAGSQVVVGGNNLGYRSVLAGQSNQLIDPKNTKEFAKRLKIFILRPQLRHKASEWQNRRVKDFDVRTVGPQLVNIYEQAIAKRN